MLALLEFRSHCAWSQPSSVLLSLTFLRGTVGKDSSGSTGEGQAGWGSRALMPGRPGQLAPSLSPLALGWPWVSEGRSLCCRGRVLTTWPRSAALMTSCYLDAFFWSCGWHFARPRLCPGRPVTQGALHGSWSGKPQVTYSHTQHSVS